MKSRFDVRPLRKTSSRGAAAFLLMILLCCSFNFVAGGQEAGNTSSGDATNELQSLRAYLQLQEQLHQNAQAIDATRRQAGEAAAQNSKALSEGIDALTGKLKSMEDALVKQRSEEVRALQSSYHTILFFLGGFALLAILAMVVMVYFQWRAVNRLTSLPALITGRHSLNHPSAANLLSSGDTAPSAPVMEVNARLMAALDQLEKRLIGLEQGGKPRLQLGDQGKAGIERNGSLGAHQSHEQGSASDLLEQGRVHLEQDRAAEALVSFESALKIDPENPDIWVRKGTALEKLGRLEHALGSMDKALELDPDYTLALLLKGGILNRMEKFAEALECFEKAARTHDNHIG